MANTLFGVYEPATDDGPGILELFTEESPAQETFERTIKDGTANRAVGQYLYRIEVEEENKQEVIEGFDQLFKNGFTGANVEELDKFAGNDTEEWGDDALGALDSDFDDSDEDYAITD